MGVGAVSTGLEIAIEKTSESDGVAEYQFMVREGRGGYVVAKPTARPGHVTIAKDTGRVVLRVPCPDDADGALFARVVAALDRHWRNAEYPNHTSWAG
jgi:hypothetical protein